MLERMSKSSSKVIADFQDLERGDGHLSDRIHIGSGFSLTTLFGLMTSLFLLPAG